MRRVVINECVKLDRKILGLMKWLWREGVSVSILVKLCNPSEYRVEGLGLNWIEIQLWFVCM